MYKGMNDTRLKAKAITALKAYVARKNDEAIKASLSRKFNYMRRLKAVLRLFRNNVAFRKA